MGTVFVKAACFILIIFLGYASKRLGLLRQEDLPVFSKLVIKITLPAAIVTNFSRITMDVSMLSIVAVGFLLSGFYMAVGYLLFWNGTREEKAFGLLNASGYNIGCFTMPFVQSFLGPAGVAVTSLFDAGNSMICTGISYTAASAVAGKGRKSGPAGMVLRLFSSIPFDCYILMTVLTLLHLRLPAVVLSFAETVGNANSFLSLMMIGLGINLHMSRKQVRSAAKIVGTRLLISAALSVGFYFFGPFSEEIRHALAVLMFAPVASLCVAYTSMIEGDVNLASAVNSVSILTAIVSLTAAVLLLI